VEKKADLNAQNDRGLTAFDLAVKLKRDATYCDLIQPVEVVLRKRLKEYEVQLATAQEREQQLSAALETKDAELKKATDDLKCIVCEVRSVNRVFEPCQHAICCAECADRVNADLPPQCPTCRKFIDETKVFYHRST
jgi:hypothetical protein